MTMQNEQAGVERPETAVAPQTPPAQGAAAAQQPKAGPKKAPAAQPVRRVGSTTMGIALIALGVCFLLYYFVPGFNWLLMAKLSPVLLVVLGVEVLVCSFRQERTKYDFLAIFSCLIVMCACFCVTLVPLIWEYAGPKAEAVRRTLTDQYESEVYDTLRTGKEGALALDGIEVWLYRPFGSEMPTSLDSLEPETTVSLSVELSGPYDSTEDFAADCRRVLDAAQEQQPLPEYLHITYNDPDGWRYSLDLDSKVQLDWDTANIARNVEDGRAERAEEEAERAAERYD